MTQEELEKISKKQLSLTAAEIDKRLKSIPSMQEKIDALSQTISPNVYGYMRVSGVSDPQLSYRHYAGSDEFAQDPFSIFYPCLVGNNFTGKVGQILHVLRKLDYETDLQGKKHAIDGSEGELMICNIQPFYKLFGKYVIENVTYDVYLLSLMPFSLAGYEAEKVEKQGHSADYCVAHKDTDGVTRMHSCYNPAWLGSYTANDIVKGSYVYEEEDGVITETYNEEEPILHSTGAGLNSYSISLYNGEQYAMNINEDNSSTVPFMNSTAGMWELITDIMLAEGGTFAAHKPSLMGSGFCNNSPSVASSYEETTSNAYNGCRFVDSKGTMRYRNFDYNSNYFGGKISCFANLLNAWSTPWRIMERQRAMSYAIRNGIPELTWFVFEGTKYKWRGVDGFKTPLQGEMTCVLTKIMKTKFASGAEDPYNTGGDISGKDLEFVVSTALFHGIVTDTSPSWWTSGLIFVEDSKHTLQCYYQRDQSKLLKSLYPNIKEGELFSFERTYAKVLTLKNAHGTYVQDYNAQCHFVPSDGDAIKGASLYTYVGRYWTNGTTVEAGKRTVRGFRRGASVADGVLSPLCVYASNAPSAGYSVIAFGICVQIVDE